MFNSLELGVGGHAEGLDSTWDIYTLSSELVLASDLEKHSLLGETFIQSLASSSRWLGNLICCIVYSLSGECYFMCQLLYGVLHATHTRCTQHCTQRKKRNSQLKIGSTQVYSGLLRDA